MSEDENEKEKENELRILLVDLGQALEEEINADSQTLDDCIYSTEKMINDISTAGRVKISNRLRDYETEINKLDVLANKNSVNASESIKKARDALYRFKRTLVDDINLCGEAEIQRLNVILRNAKETSTNQLKNIKEDILEYESGRGKSGSQSRHISFEVNGIKETIKKDITECKIRSKEIEDKYSNFVNESTDKFEEKANSILTVCKDEVQHLLGGKVKL